MSRQLTAPAPVLPGLADDRHVSRLIDSFMIEDDGREVTLDRLPSKDERELFVLRNNNLKRSLRRCDAAMADLDRAKRDLAVMFNGYPAMRNDDVDARLLAYLLVLQSYPLFAILEAIQDVAHNRYENLDPMRPPTSPLLARRCADIVARVATEQLRLDKILSAKKVMRVETAPGAHDRVMASLRDFRGRVIVPDGDERRAMLARQAQRDRLTLLREWNDLGLPVVYSRDGQPMSVALARQYGLLRERNYEDR